MNVLTVLLGLFVLSYGALVLIIWRRPLVGRIALREAVRRPGQTAVVVGGLMIAGASIFLIQVISDSMYEYNRTSAVRSWGRDDIEVTAGGTFFEPALTQRLAADPSLSSAAAFQSTVVTTGSVVDVDRNLGKPGVQVTGLDIEVQHRFDPFTLTDGRTTYGDELGTGGVFLTQALADDIGARAGDHLTVQAGGPSPQQATVVGIIRPQGAGAYGNRRSAFGALPTIQHLVWSDRINLIRVSAPGTGDREMAAARQLAPLVRAAVAGDGAQVLETKRGALELASQMQNASRGFLTSLGVIVALAATAMVANLAVMLAEERRPRLAVLRALGLTRGGLVQLSLTEGALYSLVAALVGVPFGLALGALIVSHPTNPEGTGFILSVVPGSLIGSVAAASLINLVTVLIVSIGTSSMAISSAIRDLPEPQRPRRSSLRRLAVMALIGLGGLAAVTFGNPFLRVSGGALVIAAASGLLRGRVSDRIRFSGAGLGAAAWAIAYWWIVSRTISAADGTGPLAGALVVSVVGLSVLVASNLGLLEKVGGVLGLLSGWLRATLRPALAYSSRRPLRTGLVIAAFSIVTAVLTISQAAVSGAERDLPASTGGWDVRATVVGTNELVLPAELAPKVARQESLSSRTFLGPVKWTFADFRGTADWHQEAVTVYGLSQQQLAGGIMPLTDRDGSFQTDAAAWAAISRDPGLVASSQGVGSVVYVAAGQNTLRFKVVAQLPSVGNSAPGILPGLVGSQQALASLAASPPGATLLLKAAPGTAAQALARDVQRALLAQGAEASPVLQLVEEQYAASRGVLDFFVFLMRVGLLVGILGLGAVALRAVIERRRAIGVLRAIGFQPPQVLAGMLIETALIASAGLAVGLAVAYGLGGALFSKLSPDTSFTLDGGGFLLTVALVYAAVLLVTFLPALRAARLRPAEALRAVG
ncbi:MAG: FtsX-like permease family protein [Candidatus Dormibacteraeota bacterium]|nr:FtsX-like permease family protein [Candidatus Dormibacteraeota bacterium]